jgi:hypothetical protein
VGSWQEFGHGKERIQAQEASQERPQTLMDQSPEYQEALKQFKAKEKHPGWIKQPVFENLIHDAFLAGWESAKK